MTTVLRSLGLLRKTIARALVALLSVAFLAWAPLAKADSVGQVQTTISLAPETVQVLIDRLLAGQPGMQQGDVINYIIQFATIANGASVGAGGYVTNYIPAGAEVVGAWFVQPSGNDFVPVAPWQPATMPDGWGGRGEGTFNANWSTTDASTLAACDAAGKTLSKCTGRLTEVYGDTGIFFSNDPRTASFSLPSTDGRVRQGGGATGNGYYVTPTAEGQLNPLIGQTSATTHNYWDASSTNAFGSSSIPANTPRSDIPVASNGQGAGPYNAGSAVAGPDSGYKLDYTGQTGPWQRVYYAGSMVGTNALGPATAAGVSAVAGTPTAQGWSLSTSNPLPSNTNAVRWAVGRLTVGDPSHVKIALRLTATPPTTGLISNAEVFGGDASADTAGKGKDHSWRYHVPSVASNNTNLLMSKKVVGVCSGGTMALARSCTLAASSGNVIPSDFVKLRYRLAYLNTGASTQTNVVLSDALPFVTGKVETLEAGNIYIINGPDIRSAVTTSGATLSNNAAAPGAAREAPVTLTSLVANTERQTATFTTLPSLVGGSGGSFEIDIIVGDENGTNTSVLGAGAIVGNQGTLSSAEVPEGAVANVISTVADSALLQVSKTTSTPNVTAGGTATYTLTVTNTGTLAASAIVINDLLPFTGTVADATRRFSYVGTAGAPGTGTTYGGSTPAGTVTLALAVPPTVNGYTTNANQQQVRWTFPAASTLAPGASFTLTFDAAVGSHVPASSVTYNNDVVVNYDNGPVTTIATVIQTAPVTVTFALGVRKTIDCIYDSALTQCAAYSGNGVVPSNAKVRYKLAYENTGTIAQSNVFLCDRISSSQSSPALTSTISQPSVAPTPAGAYLDAPNIGVPAQIVAGSAAETACGYSGSNTYAFPVIASLAAGATGVAYVDLATNVTANSNLTNSGKIATAGGSSISTVSAVARDVANLTVSKTTTTPTLSVGGTASYTITLTNIGNAAAGNINVYDFLPFVGTTADATKRFNYVATSATTTLTEVTPTTAVPPTVTPNSSNANQQQVLWNFGSVQTLAPGASATIAFTAQAGSAIASGSAVYGNDVQVRYTHGAAGTAVVAGGISNTAQVTIPVNLSITKSIDCVYAGATCTAYVGGDGLPVNAKIRYKLSYQNIGTITQTDVILSDTLPTQTAAGSVSNVVLVSGTTPPTTAISPASPAGSGATFSFATMASLASGASGVVTFDVQTNAAVGNTVTNLGKIVSSQDSIGKTSSVSASVTELVMAKTIDCVYDGTTCTAGSYVAGTPITANAKIRYKIAYSNPGTTAINTITICDQLPPQIFAASATYVTNFASTGTAPTGAQTYPAAAACGLTGSNNFSYSNTMNLAAGASGSVLFDVQTNATAREVVTNVGKLVAGTQNVSSSVSATVGVPTLVVTKTASPTAAFSNGTVTYTLTVSNTGSIATQTLKIFDFLPFSGSVVDATKRFAFDPAFTPTFTYTDTAAGSPVRTEAVPPAIAPYSDNANQQQVLWDFGSYALAPGGSVAITFRTTVGSAMPEASYYNVGYAEFSSASGPGNARAITALVSVTNPKPALLFLKTVAVVSDPVNGGSDPKNIPGAEVVYTLRVTNTGPGTVDNNALVITDPIPANTDLFVGDLSGANTGPIQFVQGAPTSGLTWSYVALGSASDDVGFYSDSACATLMPADPVPPYDAAVRCIRLNPKGVMDGVVSGNPFFDLKFKVRVR